MTTYVIAINIDSSCNRLQDNTAKGPIESCLQHKYQHLPTTTQVPKFKFVVLESKDMGEREVLLLGTERINIKFPSTLVLLVQYSIVV